MRTVFRYAAWLAIVVAMFLLIAQPVGHSARFNLSVIVIAILAAIMLLKLDGFWRHVFLALASVVILQYAYWRTTSTLPPWRTCIPSFPASFSTRQRCTAS